MNCMLTVQQEACCLMCLIRKQRGPGGGPVALECQLNWRRTGRISCVAPQPPGATLGPGTDFQGALCFGEG